MSDENTDSTSNENGSSDSSDAAAKAEAEKWKNEYLYLRADFDNYKKHSIKERSDLLKFGSERLVIDMLDVLDNFERALAADVTAENHQNFVKGMQMTAQELKTALNKFGVTEVPARGEAFNPALHEALSSEVTDNTPEGHIVQVFKKPYKMHDKIIRPGQVVVAKKPENS